MSDNAQPQAPTEAPKAPVLNVVPKETQAPAPEAPKTEQDPKSQEAFSKRFSALNRERKEIDQEKAKFQKERAAYEAEKKELAKWREERDAIKNSKNPLKALEANGYTYEDLAQYMLNDNKPTPEMHIKEVSSKIAELEAKLQEKERIALENEEKLLKIRQQEDNQMAIQAIKDHLSKSPEHDAILALGAENEIFNKINSHYQETGEVLQIDDVAREYVTKVEEILNSLSKTSIFKTKFQQQAVKEAPKTLSNSLHSQTPPKEDKRHYKTDEERMRNAIALLSK